jgi:hypothetical protein
LDLVKKASEYRQHAEECRALSRSSRNDEHRSQLLKMAETWEGLAAERERLLKEQEEMDAVDCVFHSPDTGFANFPS